MIHPVDVASVIESFKPRSALLSEMAEEYLSLRSIEQTPLRVALTTFIAVAGDRDVRQYSREDTKVFRPTSDQEGKQDRDNQAQGQQPFSYTQLCLLGAGPRQEKPFQTIDDPR